MTLCALVALAGPAVFAATHEIIPDHHSRVFSASKDPVLRIKSGDTVITKTWDSGGADYKAVKHIEHPYKYPESGNPLMGPFYVEGAEYGDSIAVHLDKVRLNRNYGYTSYRLSPGILNPGAAETMYKNFYKMDVLRPGRADLIPWDLDIARGIATPRLLQTSGRKIEIPVKPMLGCIGVAPPGEKVETSGPAGSWGGNMDYNDIAEGATIYFPVYHKGAFFYLGDGHAAQGDGEGLGSGIETSLDVQFTITVRKGKALGMPRIETADFIGSIAAQPEFSSSTESAIRSANSDMLGWLTKEYKFSDPEAHMLMGAAVQHKIATYYGTTITIIPKKYLPPAR